MSTFDCFLCSFMARKRVKFGNSVLFYKVYVMFLFDLGSNPSQINRFYQNSQIILHASNDKSH